MGHRTGVHISVIGTGYLGATHAACLASLGHTVVGVDTDASRIQQLAAGTVPFHEPGLQGLLTDGLASGLLAFDTDLSAARGAEVHFLCVGTPSGPGGRAADLSALDDVVADLAPLLEHPCVVAGKSTVPVGTATGLRDRLRDLAPAGDEVLLAWNPEFLREGHAVEDSLHPDRLVFGVEERSADEALRAVYARVIDEGVPVVRTDLATAELAKVSANAMLAARVSLVNLLAEVCEEAGGDVEALTGILGMDPRIGSRFLNPGLGYGGGCLPKDTRAFAWRAEQLGVTESTALLHAVDTINMRQRARTVDLAARLAGRPLETASIGVLGAAFKADSDDVRDSPALDVATTLAARGARVCAYDPRAGRHLVGHHPRLAPVGSVEDACRDADVVLVLTEWEEFGALDPVSLGALVRQPRILDGRLVLDPEKWRAAGWQLHALGRGDSAR